MFDDPLSLLLIGWGMMALLMAFLWMVQLKTGDAGIVDVAWGTGVGILAVFYAWRGDGDEIRRYVVGALALGWSLRLSSYILKRVLQMPEDGRYQTLKEGWVKVLNGRCFGSISFKRSAPYCLPCRCCSRVAIKPS